MCGVLVHMYMVGAVTTHALVKVVWKVNRVNFRARCLLAFLRLVCKSTVLQQQCCDWEVHHLAACGL